MNENECVVMEGNEANRKGVIAQLGSLPSGALINEIGLATIFGKCRDSIKSAVNRGELPPPVRIMGKPTWTVGKIISHIEGLLESEARKINRHSA